MKKIRLVQSPESARVLLEDARKQGGWQDAWVCLDATSELLLRKAGISFYSQDRYVSQADAKRVDEAAHRMAGDWYQGFQTPLSVTRLGLRSESFIRRDINYCLQGMLRTFCFLEGLRRTEGVCRIIWSDTPAQRGIRLTRGESFIGAWLETSNDRWDFEYERLVSDISKTNTQNKHCNFMDTVLSLFCRLSWGGGAGGEIWFHGNPSLLDPVKKELEARGRTCQRLRTVDGWKQWVGAMRPGNVAFTRFTGIPKPLFSKEQLVALRKSLESSEGLDFDGVSVGRVFFQRIASFYADRVESLRRESELIEKLLLKQRPSLIILDEDVTEFGSILSETATKIGIPCLTIVHGIPGKPLGSVPSRSTHIACWGRYDHQQLVHWGVNADKITITGCPKYDRLRSVDPSEKRSKKSALKLDPTKPVVLLAPTSVPVNCFERLRGLISNPDERMRLLSNFLKIAASMEDCQFVLKFHGKLDDPLVVESAVASAGLMAPPPNFRVVHSGSAIPWIEASDRIVSLASSILLEALLVGTPVLIANFSNFPNVLDIENAQTRLWHLRSIEEAREACSQLSTHRASDNSLLASQREVFEKFNYDPGNASKRVANLAESILADLKCFRDTPAMALENI